MDASLIYKFRNKINENQLILHIYRNYNGKNKWNCICSAVDWIQIGVSGIDISSLESSNTDQASVRVITFISCIDVMWEGIQQLHRVLNDTTEIPFEGRSDLFHKEIDDNRYWKEIRAAFAAHPTKLDGLEKGERRFASWSGGGFGNSGDFSVIVYSNDPQKSPELFDISFYQILQFAKNRYEHLNDLIIRINEIELQWCEKWRKKPIILSGNVLTDIDMLLKENKNRFNNDNYEYRLEEIKKVFEVEIHGERNKVLIEEYRKALESEIQTIAMILGKMYLEYDYETIDDFEELEYNYPNQHIFEPEKGLLSWAIEELKKPLGKYVSFESAKTIEEIQVLVRAGWWKYNQKKLAEA